jgi:hypothetical protein
MTPDDRLPPDLNVLSWEVAELKKQVHSGFAQMRTDMRDQLTRLEGTVERMTFVDVKLYTSEQRAQDRAVADLAAAMATLKADIGKRIDETEKRVDNAESGNRTTLIYLVGIVLVALAGGLVRLALG